MYVIHNGIGLLDLRSSLEGKDIPPTTSYSVLCTSLILTGRMGFIIKRRK